MLRIENRAFLTNETGTKHVGNKFLDCFKEVLVRDFLDPYLELVKLLHESSRIEHILWVQYLFVAYSIKPKFSSLLGFFSPDSNGFFGVAAQKMSHLYYVNEFLIRLEVLPNFERGNFPAQFEIYPFRLNLERLGPMSLAKFIYINSPAKYFYDHSLDRAYDGKLTGKLNEVLGLNYKVNYLGSIYSTIIEVASELETSGQLSFSIQENIIRMKEIKKMSEESHFEFFRNVFMGTHTSIAHISNIWDLPISDTSYPSFEISPNLSALKGHTYEIKDDQLRLMAYLGNIHYWIVLKLLLQAYLDGSNFMEYMKMSKNHIVGPMKIISAKLAQKGHGIPFDRLSVGYTYNSRAHNYLDIVKLLIEGRTISHLLQNLPSAFNFEIYNQSVEKLKILNQSK
ncbi:MAG: ferritin-like domain-containing protein [Bacteroidota bacterium]